MARLPRPGGDPGNWGGILNDYLLQSHKADGTLKDNSVGTSQLKDDSVTAAAIAPGTITKADVGLANVDNTSDLSKPVSSSTQAALSLKADTSALAAKLTTTDLDAQVASRITLNGTATQTALGATFVKPDCVVHATPGLGTHTTLAAAIADAPSGGLIHVRSNLTITTKIQVSKQLRIEWLNGARVFNNSSDTSPSDTIGSNVADGANGAVNYVELINPYFARDPSKSARAGKAINFHGAFGWKVWSPQIYDHSDGLYFNAEPSTSGQSSHNTVYDPSITRTDNAIRFYNANINQILNAHTYGCGTDVWSESSPTGNLDNTVSNLRAENLGPNQRTTPGVVIDGGVVFLPDFHMEQAIATHAIEVNGGSLYGNGNAYFTPGGGANGAVVLSDAARNCDVRLHGQGHYKRDRGGLIRNVRTQPITSSVEEWYGVAVDDGPPILRAAMRSDGVFRLPPLSADPSTASIASGDMFHKTMPTSGNVLPVMRNGSFYQPYAPTELMPSQAKLRDISSSITTSPRPMSIFRATNAVTLLDIKVIPDDFVAGTAGSDFWVVQIEEWNGNVFVANIGAAYTQSGQIGMDGVSISAGNHALAANRIARVRFTKTGTPGTWYSPLVLTRYAPA